IPPSGPVRHEGADSGETLSDTIGNCQREIHRKQRDFSRLRCIAEKPGLRLEKRLPRVPKSLAPL
ncbi:MAG: hypothetical protein KDJ63_05695, partial [Nitratireductor sp.]|nr:hypothetical protein [Nitratireductor sp.]